VTSILENAASTSRNAAGDGSGVAAALHGDVEIGAETHAGVAREETFEP